MCQIFMVKRIISCKKTFFDQINDSLSIQERARMRTVNRKKSESAEKTSTKH